MKRKVPVSFTVVGFIMSLMRYSFILILALIFIIIGLLGPKPMVTAGLALLVVYVCACVAEQISMLVTAKRKSQNESFNEIMDQFYGVEDTDSDSKDDVEQK